MKTKSGLIAGRLPPSGATIRLGQRRLHHDRLRTAADLPWNQALSGFRGSPNSGLGAGRLRLSNEGNGSGGDGKGAADGHRTAFVLSPTQPPPLAGEPIATCSDRQWARLGRMWTAINRGVKTRASVGALALTVWRRCTFVYRVR